MFVWLLCVSATCASIDKVPLLHVLLCTITCNIISSHTCRVLEVVLEVVEASPIMFRAVPQMEVGVKAVAEEEEAGLGSHPGEVLEGEGEGVGLEKVRTCDFVLHVVYTV